MIIESEKKLERKLNQDIKNLGGLSIKLLSSQVTGLPDRLCLLPGGRLFFVEVKTTGKKPNKIQDFVHRQFRALGFVVAVIDTTEKLNNLLNDYR